MRTQVVEETGSLKKNRSKIMVLWDTVMMTLRSFKNFRAYKPFFLFFFMQVTVLMGLVFFLFPPFSWVFLPFSKMIAGEAIVHYPNNMIVLPQLFDLLSMVLSGIVGIIISGYASHVFFFAYPNNEDSISLRAVLAKYPYLFLIWCLQMALILGSFHGLAELASTYPAAGKYFGPVRTLLVVLLSSVFAYTTVLIVIQRENVLNAVKESFVLFKEHTVITFLAVSIPVILHLPYQFVMSKTPSIARNLNPEVIPAIIAAGMLFSMLTNFFSISTIVQVYLKKQMVEGKISH